MNRNLIAALFLLIAATSRHATHSTSGAADPLDSCEPVVWHLSDVWAPTFSPDGGSIAFESALDLNGNFSPGIYIHDLATDAERKVFDDPSWITDLSWSPTKNMMLLEHGYPLSVLDIGTGDLRYQNTLRRDMSGAVWTWEGDSIYYTRGFIAGYNPPDSIGLFVTAPDAGPGRKFTLAQGTAPSGSFVVFPGEAVDQGPGGEWLAFQQPTAGPSDPPGPSGSEIWIVRRDGSGLRQLTHLNAFVGQPRWIDNGRAVIFEYYPRGCDDLANPVGHTWIVRTDGSPPARYAVDLSGREVQFGFPPAVDRSERQVAATLLNPKTGYGALYLMDPRGTHKRLLHPLAVPTSAARPEVRPEQSHH